MEVFSGLFRGGASEVRRGSPSDVPRPFSSTKELPNGLRHRVSLSEQIFDQHRRAYAGRGVTDLLKEGKRHEPSNNHSTREKIRVFLEKPAVVEHIGHRSGDWWRSAGVAGDSHECNARYWDMPIEAERIQQIICPEPCHGLGITWLFPRGGKQRRVFPLSGPARSGGGFYSSRNEITVWVLPDKDSWMAHRELDHREPAFAGTRSAGQPAR